MAEREALQKRYAYSEMSNKVQRADRRRDPGAGSRGDPSGPTGEVESLWNVLPADTLGRMGDRVAESSKGKEDARPAEVKDMMERAARKRKKRAEQAGGGGAEDGGPGIRGGKRRGGTGSLLVGAGGTILDDAAGDGGGTYYRPSNPVARS